MSVHRRRPTCLGDESAEIFDLALDSVGCGVAAVAPAATVVIEDGEMLCELLCGRAGQSPVAHRSAHHDYRQTIAQPIEGDGGAIRRGHLVHEAFLSLVVYWMHPLTPSRAKAQATAQTTAPASITAFLLLKQHFHPPLVSSPTQSHPESTCADSPMSLPPPVQ